MQPFELVKRIGKSKMSSYSKSKDASIKESEQYKELGKRSPSAGMFYSEYIKLKNKQYDKNH